MSVNSSSSSNDCLLNPDLSSINSSFVFSVHCYIVRPSSVAFVVFNINNILLLPLYIFILYLGLQRWHQQRSSTKAATMSHSDSFTYNMVAMELVGVFGSSLCCCAIYIDNVIVLSLGTFLLSFTWMGQMFFHILTCVERYLAVVHPITYLSLRKERVIRMRNITNGCVWLLSLVVTYLLALENDFLDICLLVIFFIVIMFCSVSVLCVLTRPGPGEQGRDRERVDQSKQRAIYTIMVILGVLVLRCIWAVMWFALYVLRENCECLMMMLELWLNIPSSLVLPVLFLHRSGNLVRCKTSIQQE